MTENATAFIHKDSLRLMTINHGFAEYENWRTRSGMRRFYIPESKSYSAPEELNEFSLILTEYQKDISLTSQKIEKFMEDWFRDNFHKPLDHKDIAFSRDNSHACFHISFLVKYDEMVFEMTFPSRVKINL